MKCCRRHQQLPIVSPSALTRFTAQAGTMQAPEKESEIKTPGHHSWVPRVGGRWQVLSGSEEWGRLHVTRNSRSEAGDVRRLMEDDISVAVKGEGLSSPDRAEPALDSTWGLREEIPIPSPVACRGSAPRQRSKGIAGRRKPGNLAMARRTVKTEAAAAPGRLDRGSVGKPPPKPPTL